MSCGIKSSRCFLRPLRDRGAGGRRFQAARFCPESCTACGPARSGKALPSQFGSGSTCHAPFQAWSEAGIFRRLFETLVEFYDDVCGVEWEWASLDSAIVKAPKGGDATGG